MVYGASAGYIFLCSDPTEWECIRKGLFGASIQNFEQHIGPETKLFLYNISTKQLKGLWSPRGNAGESIDPTAFNGSFKAQLAVQRTSQCTPAPLIKIQGIVKFYRPGRFQQHLTKQQVAALSLLLSLKPIRPSLTAPQSKAATAKPSMAAVPKPMVAEQPSASCRVTQPAPAKAALQDSAATAVAPKSTEFALPEKAPKASEVVSSNSSLAPAKGSGTKQPYAFRMNGLKGKAGSAAGAQHKRKLSLAAVLDDVFEEVLSTPRSRKKKRRLPTVHLAEPLEQPLPTTDPTVIQAREQQAAGNSAHSPMSLLDLTVLGTEAAPAPAVPARKQARKWDQMPEHMQSSAAANQQKAASAVPEPKSSAAMPVDPPKAAHKPPAQLPSGPKPQEAAPEHQGAPAVQALEPSTALHAQASAGAAPEASKALVQESAPDQAAQVQNKAGMDPDLASKPLHVQETAAAAPEELQLPVEASAADQAARVQDKASKHSGRASQPLHVKEVAATAPEAPNLPAQASAADLAARAQEEPQADRDPANAAVTAAPSQAAHEQKNAGTTPERRSGAVRPLVPGCALICTCSAQEADESFNRHQLPLPRQLRQAHPRAVIRQGMRVFLHNADTRRLLGPFYAKQAKGSDEKVLVTEKEPVQALKEVDVLAKLMPRTERLTDLGPVTEPSMTQQICKAFQEAAIPNRIQPYRMLGGNLGGAVFVCSAGTVQSCLQKGLLGMMQDTYIPIVQHVSVGMPVFLFNHSDRTLLGPLSAVSPGGMYLDERAWARPGHRSPWPAQVRVAVHHPVIALQEKVFKPLVEAAYYSPNAFHFDLSKAEALSLLEAFTHRQVLYHQHLQHRQGHAYFVPPAMCQQLLEVARRVSRPSQQPARAQQLHTNAYLAVLESGLSTQKKPAKRPDEDVAPEPPPLEEILGRDPGELEPGELLAPGNEGNAADAAADELPPLPAEEGQPGDDATSGSAAIAQARSQQISFSTDRPPLPTDLSLESGGAELGTNSAAPDRSVQPPKEPESSSSLLERFDAARQHTGRSGAMLATGGTPAVGAQPSKPSPMAEQQLPMLSPLVLSSAPHHTPMQDNAGSAPAAQDQAFSFARAGQLQPQPGSNVYPQQGQAAGQHASEMSLAQCAGTEQKCDVQPAEPNSFSFDVASSGQPPATPPSFMKLLQEYGSSSGKPTAPEQLQQPVNGNITARALRRRRARTRNLKKAVLAAAAREAGSAQDTSEESAASETMPAASTQHQSSGPAEAPGSAAAIGPSADSSAQRQAASDEGATVMDIAEGTNPLQLTHCNGPQLRSKEPDANATPACSVQLSVHEYLSAPKVAAPLELLMPSLRSIVQEAAEAGTMLSASRRSQLADALQGAALAASQLHLALQSASTILRSEPEPPAPTPQHIPFEDSTAPCAAVPGRVEEPGNGSMLMLTAGAGNQAAVPVETPSKAAGPALQRNGSKKRNRLANESSAAADSDNAAVVKKLKRSEGAAGTARGAKVGMKSARKVKALDQHLLAGADISEGWVRSSRQGDSTAGQPNGQVAALSPLTRLREGVQPWRAGQAGREADVSEDGSSLVAVIDHAAADASNAAVEAQHVAVADAAEILGLAAENGTCNLPNEESTSPPPDPPPSPPHVASRPAASTRQPAEQAQAQGYRPIEHPSLSPPKQPRPDLLQQQPGVQGQGLPAQHQHQRGPLPIIQPGQAMLQAPAFGAAHQSLPPQHAPHQAGSYPGMPFSRAAHMMHVPMRSQGLHFQLVPGGNLSQQPPQQMQGNAMMQPQQSSQPPWQLDMPRIHPQQQQRQQQLQITPPKKQVGLRPGLQQAFPPNHPLLQVQPVFWHSQQQQQSGGPGMLPQHPRQLWASGQPWGSAWQPGLPLPQPPPHQQAGAPSGQVPVRPPAPPAHAPPALQLQPQLALPASAQPPQQPRLAQPPASATLQLQSSSQPAVAVQAQQLPLSSQPLQLPGQDAIRGQAASGREAAVPVMGPEPGDPPALPQLGVPGSFKFNAGKVGSAGKSKAKKRRGDLSSLQRQLEQQRAQFLQWHQQELNRAQGTGKRKTLKAKRKELAQLTQQLGGPETLEQVQTAGGGALLAAAGNGSGAASVSTSLASLRLGAAEGEVASANGGVEHVAVQMTPLGQTAGMKRKRLQNGNTLSKLVAFDTNVYMGNNGKDPKVIAQVLRAWSLISPSVIILVPIVVMSELNCLATNNNKQLSQLAAAGLKVLQSVLASSIAHVQLPHELPEGRSTNRLKDDGILDCLRHFKEAGYHIFLCTRDKQFACRSQAQGIEAVAPDLLSARPEYPLQVEMTPLPPKKRSKNAEGAAQGDLSAQPGAVREQVTAQPSAVQDDFIAL